MDLVAHCGDSAAGEYVNTLSTIDLASGWSERVGVMGKSQKAVFAGLQQVREQPGAALDAAIGQLLVEAVSPLALEVVLNVQQELTTCAEETERLRRQQLERARYPAELAQRRFLRVDPDNRLMADSLEADWDDKLRALAAAQH